MKKIFTLITFISCSFSLFAQVCLPDTVRYRDSTAGVFPLPYDPLLSPNGGINKPACLGRPYSFTFTVKVSDSISFNGLRLPLDSLYIATTGAVTGLPTGISYSCNPPSCSFRRRTYGCIVLSGTPAQSNTLGDFQLRITGTAVLSGFPLQQTFPSANFPGEYKIRLLAANSTECTASTADALSEEVSGLQVAPNPNNGHARILLSSVFEGNIDIKIIDITGKILDRRSIRLFQGANSLELAAENLPNGIYMLQLAKGEKTMTGRFVIQR